MSEIKEFHEKISAEHTEFCKIMAAKQNEFYKDIVKQYVRFSDNTENHDAYTLHISFSFEGADAKQDLVTAISAKLVEMGLKDLSDISFHGVCIDPQTFCPIFIFNFLRKTHIMYWRKPQQSIIQRKII